MSYYDHLVLTKNETNKKIKEIYELKEILSHYLGSGFIQSVYTVLQQIKHQSFLFDKADFDLNNMDLLKYIYVFDQRFTNFERCAMLQILTKNKILEIITSPNQDKNVIFIKLLVTDPQELQKKLELDLQPKYYEIEI